MAQDEPPAGSNGSTAPPSPQRKDWQNLLVGTRPTSAELTLIAPMARSTRGGSGAFLGMCSNNQRYWIKPPNTKQGAYVHCIEQIVARAGQLIGAAVCDVRTVQVLPAHAGWKFRKNQKLDEGIAHGVAAIPGTVDEHKGPAMLQFRQSDDNRSRHATYLALYDWCWGHDEQCLVDTKDNMRFYSHDHGLFFPPKGTSWDNTELENRVDEPHEFSTSDGNFDLVTIAELIDNLLKLTRDELLGVLQCISQQWSATDVDLEAVGYFLERRAPATAYRLKKRFGV